jgi:hypothetical protein
MSWISDHYEKALVAGSLIAAVALTYTGLLNKNSLAKDFPHKPKGTGSNDASVIDGDKVAIAKSSFQIDQKWVQSEFDGRAVDLFTGVPLFVDKNNREKPVDLPKSNDVHPPIENKWWIEHRIDPGFADSPKRDEDKDGFTNLEEFEAKTDPTDPTSHPNLITKLVYLGDESVRWLLRPSGFPTDADPGVNFEYADSKRVKVKTSAADPIKPNGVFFSGDAVKERFKYLGFAVKQVKDPRLEADVDTIIVKVEDQKPNKKGKIYEITANFRPAEQVNFAMFDRTAKLSLEALGFGGQEFKVEELTEFALPRDSTSKSFRMMEVTPARIVVRETLKDGTSKLHEINKRP